MLPALSKAPCLVAFSGGRDSSAILAMATSVARRHGLADPIPLTFRYPDHPRTWETDWQELIVRHLALKDWKIVDFRTELDVLGRLARATLRRHGLYWPPGIHAMIPMLEAARGSSLLTGNGGDEVFSSIVTVRKMTAIQILRSMPLHRALLTGVVNTLPLRWRILVQYHKGLRFPWLRPAARREVRRLFVANSAQQHHERHYLETLDDTRYRELSRSIVAALATDASAFLVEPFFDPRFHRVLLEDSRKTSFPRRNAAMAHYFGDLLPPEMAQRTTKAVFTESAWGPDSRDFARRWDGSGLDASLVYPDVLREQWQLPKPDMRSATAIQAAWLAAGGEA